LWPVAAGAVFVFGVGIAAVSAEQVRRGDERREHQSFETSAAEIAGSLHRSIERHEDLVVTAGAFAAANPTAGAAELSAWLESVRAQERYPELVGVGLITVVEPAELSALEARLRSDPLGGLGPTQELQVMPPGEREYYCLLQASVAFSSVVPPVPVGLDFCAGDFGLGASPETIRDEGQASYLAAQLLDPDPILIVQTPIYEGGIVPPTVEERRARYLGSLGTMLSPDAVFASVLDEYPEILIDLRYASDEWSAEFRSGTPPESADVITVELGNGWTTDVIRERRDTRIVTNRAAMSVLFGGVVASASLALLVYFLGTGRNRARRLVKQRTAELHHQALHDSLTGLPNRTLIIDRVEQLLARCRRTGATGAALFVDLDHFKNVNDTFGHEAGDQLLQLVATRMSEGLRAADTIGRMGGDEFVVLVDGDPAMTGPEVVAQRLLEVLDAPFTIVLEDGPCTLHVTASIGIAHGERASAGELLRDADLALYRAKAAGRNCHEVFRPEMQTEIRSRVELEIGLHTALAENQFELHYQPIYNLADLSMIGAEALLRWNHPKHGRLDPDEFVPLLEQTGQIVEVGRWVLHQACQQAAVWRHDTSPITIAVNLSARQLDHASIVDHVREALAASGLEPSALTLEVTETALMRDPVAVADRLNEIKQLGVQIAIDDFGTGYSSLAYLQQFPVDSIKIDRAFTRGLKRSAQADALIRTLVRLGNDLGLTTLAEGVETIEQLDHLREEKVGHVQGFLLAHPLSSAAFESDILRPNTPQTQSTDTT
jgi:diguanylate cyclase (GGDEF)-like protein